MYQIILNGIDCELATNTKVTFSRQNNDLSDVSSRQGDVSNRVKIRRNKKIEALRYKKISAKILENGFEIVSTGIGIIDKIDDRYIYVQIIAGNLNFFSLIEGKSLRDLDLSDLNHDWKKETIINSQTNTEGYIYPMIDWSNDHTSIQSWSDYCQGQFMLPCFFVHTIINKIVRSVGYELEGNIITTPAYLKRIFSFGVDSLKYPDGFLKGSEVRIEQRGVKNLHRDIYIGQAQQSIFIFQKVLAMNNKVKDIDNAYSVNSGIFTAPIGSVYDFTYSIDLNLFLNNHGNGATLSNCTLTVELWKTTSSAMNVLNFETKSFNGNNFTGNYSGSVQGVTAAKNELIYLNFTFSGTLTNPAQTYTTLDIEMTGGSNFNVKISDEITYGGTFVAAAVMPDISQSDFIKGILNQLYAVPFVDDDNKTLRLDFFDTVKKNEGKAKDITDKIDVSQNEEKTFRLQNVFQENILRWNNDETIMDETFGSGVILVGDETLPVSGVLIEQEYSATKTVTKNDGQMFCNIPKFEAGEMKHSTTVRMLINEYRQLSKPMGMNENGSTVHTFTHASVPYFSKANDDLSLDYDNLIRQHFNLLTSVLNETEIKAFRVRMTAVQMRNLDLLTPVYSRIDSQYYYISSLENYENGTVTMNVVRI